MGDKSHILSLSYGKDSIACLGAIEELGWPLDRIIHAEVWATDTIPADPPPMVEFKEKADAIILARYGIIVEHVCAMRNGEKHTYEKGFYRKKIKRSYRAGTITGFPFTSRGAWCNGDLKRSCLQKIERGNISYIGIAADEPSRFHNLTDTKKSPLVAAGWTEDICRKWCEEKGLLSPIYTTAARGGCWFCHNQSVGQLRLLRKNYPEYWALLLKWDEDSPVSFHADGHTVHDFDRRFQMEDERLIFPEDKVFRWEMLDQELNLRWL